MNKLDMNINRKYIGMVRLEKYDGSYHRYIGTEFLPNGPAAARRVRKCLDKGMKVWFFSVRNDGLLKRLRNKDIGL